MALHAVDTLAVSDSLVREFTRQAAFDYKRELVQQETNYLDQFLRWLGNLFGDTFGTIEHDSNFEFLWWIGGAVALALLLWWLQQSRFALFRKTGDGDELDYDVEIDNIHEIDFDARIAAARQAGNRREVCRLLYLQTLKHLADGELIDWRPFKTPSQYTREVNDPVMRKMTNAFLCVRYGNFEATDGLCQQMAQWQQQLVTLIPAHEDEKGGEQA